MTSEHGALWGRDHPDAHPQYVLTADLDELIPGGISTGKTPAVPTLNAPFSQVTYTNAEGLHRARLTIDWNTPLNTDTSAISDGDHYRVRWRPQGATAWQSTTVEWGVTDVIVDVEPGLTYDVQVAAFNRAGTGSGYVTDDQAVVPDTTAPAQPSAPDVFTSTLRLTVAHDLTKQAGGALDSDVDHLEVHAGASSVFTPGPLTLVGTIVANAAAIANGLAAGEFDAPTIAVVHVKVIAVDRAGNRSSASPSSSATPSRILSEQVDSLTAAKITSGTISAQTIELSGASASIESSSFLAGVLGWRIKGDGAAEFNDVTVRGDVEAASFTTTAAGTTLTITGGAIEVAQADAAEFTLLDVTSNTGKHLFVMEATSDWEHGIFRNEFVGIKLLNSGTDLAVQSRLANDSGYADFKGRDYYYFGSFGLVNLSDMRAKREVRELELDAAAAVKAAPARHYRLNEDDDDAPEHVGWIAQEVPAIARVVMPDGQLGVGLVPMVATLWDAVRDALRRLEDTERRLGARN